MYNSPSIEEIEQTEEYKEYLNYESELDAAHQKNNVSEEAKQNEEPKIQENYSCIKNPKKKHKDRG